jgi:hypothetical protein
MFWGKMTKMFGIKDDEYAEVLISLKISFFVGSWENNWRNDLKQQNRQVLQSFCSD